jgi:hypothetical protein
MNSNQAEPLTLFCQALGLSFQKRGRDRKDFAQGATEAAGGSPPNTPD